MASPAQINEEEWLSALREATTPSKKVPEGFRSAFQIEIETGWGHSTICRILKKARFLGLLEVTFRHELDCLGRRQRIPVYRWKT